MLIYHKPAVKFGDQNIFNQPSLDSMAPDNRYSQTNCLTCEQLMDRILNALKKGEPLSVVSVGQTEAFVMAQYTLLPEDVFLAHREAYNANLGEKSGFFHRGIRFPNIQARDDAVAAVKRADIVGYNLVVEVAREFAEKVFQACSIELQQRFEANLRRVFMFSQKDKFEEMLQGRKILLISSLAPEAAMTLHHLKTQLNLTIAGAIPIYEYEDIPAVKQALDSCDFDLCFLAAGVNALILAPYIAEKYGKVAFDIGWGMKSFITGEIVTDEWVTDIIGIENLLRM